MTPQSSTPTQRAFSFLFLRWRQARVEMAPMADLVEQLEVPQCHCLNEAKGHSLRHAIHLDHREDLSQCLVSDADEELLISLKFMSAVKISALQFECADADAAPAKVRLFVNKIGLDFDSAKSEAATQEIELAPAKVRPGASPVELRFVLFQNVSTLTIFIPSNQADGEETKLGKLVVLGEPITHEGLKRSEEQQKVATKGDWLN